MAYGGVPVAVVQGVALTALRELVHLVTGGAVAAGLLAQRRRLRVVLQVPNLSPRTPST